MSASAHKKTLPVLGDQYISTAIRTATFELENRTDLVAFITESDVVDVYRLGGQNVQHLESDDLSGRPTCIEWARGGEVLLIGTDSGVVDTLNLDTGRIIKGRSKTPSEPVAVTSVGTHLSRLSACNNTSTSLDQNTEGDVAASLTDWLNKASISRPISTQAGSISLPHALARLDPSDVLPKLSPIPAPSKAGPGMPAPVLRSAQKDIHTLLNSKAARDADVVEVTFTSFEGGSVDASIGDLFQRSFKDAAVQGNLMKQCAALVPGVQAIFRRHDIDLGGSEPAVVALDAQVYQVPFSVAESVHSGTILASAVQLQRLEAYISQAVDTAVLDWNTLTSLPGRFIANINDTLEEKAEGPLQNHLAQLLLTGHGSETITEWLKEELAERGHKRWDLAMTTFYHSLSHLLEVNLLPAVERCAMTASALRGLAAYYEGSKKFDVQPQLLTTVIEALSCLQLLAHEALQILSSEQKQFIAFSKWLRIRVDIAASEPGSSTHTELMESEAVSIDVPLVLSYLTNGFIKSKLEPIVGRRLPTAMLDTKLSSSTLSKDGVVDAVNALRTSADCQEDGLYLPLQMRRLQKAVEACLMQMKKWQSTTWAAPSSLQLAFDGPLTDLDVNILDEVSRSSAFATVSAIGVDAEQESRLCMYARSCSSDTRSLALKSGSQTNVVIEVPNDHKLFSPKHLKSEGILAFVQSSRTKQRPTSDLKLILLPARLWSEDRPAHIISTSDLESFVVHEFATNDSFVPASMYVSEGKRRTNVIVLDESRKRWKTLRLSGPRLQLNGDAPFSAEEQFKSPFAVPDGESMLVD